MLNLEPEDMDSHAGFAPQQLHRLGKLPHLLSLSILLCKVGLLLGSQEGYVYSDARKTEVVCM